MTSLESVELIIEWNQLGEKVRTGQKNGGSLTTPHILNEYLDLGENLAEQGSKGDRLWVYSRMVRQLEDTICDCLIEASWRQRCAEMLFRPLRLLADLAETPRERARAQQTAQSAYGQCDYFLCSQCGEQSTGL